MKPAVGTIEPVRKKVVVPASPDAAFQRFTAEIASWWPVATHSVHGPAAVVRFGEGVGARIVESLPDGATSANPGLPTDVVWGTVLEWDPPKRLRFTWHPGREPETAQEVEVTFLSTGEATEVTLVHVGWEKLADADAQRRGYDTGWDVVLGAYRDAS